MIEFSSKQEAEMLRRDCRAWTELLANEWYRSGEPGALEYPAQELTQHLRMVYMECHQAGIDNIDYVSRLGFIVLRANTLGCEGADIAAVVTYFIHHAKGDNVDYAQAWIDLYFEDV